MVFPGCYTCGCAYRRAEVLLLDLSRVVDGSMASVVVTCWRGPAVDLATLPLRWGQSHTGALSADRALVHLPVFWCLRNGA